jgi:hypothetical protein
MDNMQEIPKGLARQILKKKYGKDADTIDDVVMQKIACEKIIKYLKEKRASKSILCEMKSKLSLIENELSVKSDYLSSWYDCYFNLAAQCKKCEFNQDDDYCSFYGKKNIPDPDPYNHNQSCEHFTEKSLKNSIKIN